MSEITIIVAFIAGIISFLSPCVLPIIPGFLGYLSGTGLKDLSSNARANMFLNSIFFVLGFSSVFAALGVLLNTLLQQVSTLVQEWLGRIGGIIIILFGLYLVGLIKISFLEQDHKIILKKKWSIKYVTSFVFGAAFAVGWTPCVGAVLGSVLTLAVIEPGKSFFLLLSYALGLGLPFLLVGFFSGQAIKLIQRFGRFLKYFNIVVGILLIVLGILVFTNELSQIANFSLLNRFLLK